MKKRGLLAFLLVLACATCMAALVACGQGDQQSSSKESFSISAEPEEEEPVVLKTEPFYVLVVGNDSREGTVYLRKEYADGKGRADTAMLVRVDPKKYTFDLITIPRDTQATYDGETVKINEIRALGGMDAYKKAVKELTGVNPDYYIETTFVGFEKLIDDMGGLTINPPLGGNANDIVDGEYVEYESGKSTLDGRQALAFARERHAYETYVGGDAQESIRQVNDRYIMQTIMEYIMSLDSEKAGELAKKLYGSVDSDLTDRELAAYVEEFAKNAKKVKFTNSCTGPYAGSLDDQTGKWLAYRDEETWAKLIKAVENGDDPNEVVTIPVIDFLPQE